MIEVEYVIPEDIVEAEEFEEVRIEVPIIKEGEEIFRLGANVMFPVADTEEERTTKIQNYIDTVMIPDANTNTPELVPLPTAEEEVVAESIVEPEGE